jgi:hypothetical protein
MYRPILPCIRDGKVIYPYGFFEGVYFVEELIYAKNKGYKIKAKYGLSYEKEKIFTRYIDNMYNRRINAKNKGEKNIYKLIMNSLSGRFGMHNKDIKGVNKLFDLKEKEEIYKKKENIIKITYINDDKYNISVGEKNKYIHSSVQISAAINSYGRLYMNDIIDKLDGSIYYQDTDSIVTDKELKKDLISNTILGKFKLEHEIKKGFFIRQKTYYLINEKDEVIIKSSQLKEEEKNDFNQNYFFRVLKGIYNFKIFEIKRFERNFDTLSLKMRNSIYQVN